MLCYLFFRILFIYLLIIGRAFDLRGNATLIIHTNVSRYDRMRRWNTNLADDRGWLYLPPRPRSSEGNYSDNRSNPSQSSASLVSFRSRESISAYTRASPASPRCNSAQRLSFAWRIDYADSTGARGCFSYRDLRLTIRSYKLAQLIV